MDVVFGKSLIAFISLVEFILMNISPILTNLIPSIAMDEKKKICFFKQDTTMKLRLLLSFNKKNAKITQTELNQFASVSPKVTNSNNNCNCFRAKMILLANFSDAVVLIFSVKAHSEHVDLFAMNEGWPMRQNDYAFQSRNSYWALFLNFNRKHWFEECIPSDYLFYRSRQCYFCFENTVRCERYKRTMNENIRYVWWKNFLFQP